MLQMSSLQRSVFLARLPLRPVNRLKAPLQTSQRHLVFFRRRPLYRPITPFGRAFLRLRNLSLGIVTLSVATFSVFYLLDSRAAAHRYILTPILRLLTPDPEDAHRIAVLALKYGLHPKDTKPDDARLAVEVLSVTTNTAMGTDFVQSSGRGSRTRQAGRSGRRPV
jgi:hypothetical protein